MEGRFLIAFQIQTAILDAPSAFEAKGTTEGGGRKLQRSHTALLDKMQSWGARFVGVSGWGAVLFIVTTC